MYIYSRAMSSLIVSHNSHLMMLEIAVENLFVPWTSEFDKVILKKTIVMFRMLDEEWTSLAPNRRDRRPYRGSCCENENFYGGRSVVFCMPAGFFEKKASNVDVQLYVRREVCEYFEMDQFQNIGFATVPVDDLLNGIAKQMRERNELSEHLSNFYKQEIISRSTMGTYNLLDENFRSTVATISLYIRISCLGKCLVTEITRLESGVFCARREPDEEQPYLSRQLTEDELQSGRWDAIRDLSLRASRGRLVCRCEELIRKKDAAANLAVKKRRGPAARSADFDRSVATRTAADAAAIATRAATADFARSPMITKPDTVVIKRGGALADYDAPGGGVDADALADKRIAVTTNSVAIPVKKIAANLAIRRGKKAPANYLGALGDKMNANVKRRGIARTGGAAIKDNGFTTFFKKAFPKSGKSKRGKDTATIGRAIESGTKRILPPSAPAYASPRRQTHPLSCQSQPPRSTCFTHHLDVSPCHCDGTDRPESTNVPFNSFIEGNEFSRLCRPNDNE